MAEALFVSRTAVSKWESGRGYPSIDSLKELSRFFSVTIDELIGSGEVVAAAENEKRETLRKYTALLYGVLDILTALLLFLPVFGDGKGATAVPLFGLSNIQIWIIVVYAVAIGLTAINGISAVVINRFDKPVWNRHRLITGMALSIFTVFLFIVTRQPYAGILCFTLLLVKGIIAEHLMRSYVQLAIQRDGIPALESVSLLD